MRCRISSYEDVLATNEFRIDAEHFSTEAFNILRMIKSKEHLSFFDQIQKINSGKNLKQIGYGKRAFIRTQDVRSILLAKENVSRSDDHMECLESGDLLFVRVGEGVGNNVVATPNDSGDLFSDNLLRLKINGISPYYCSVFFNCELGRRYFRSFFKGTARKLISSSNFKNIVLPKPSISLQYEIEELCLSAEKSIELSNKLNLNASCILLNALGLLDWSPAKKLSYIAKYSETVKAERIDAEYFQPHYMEIEDAIKSYSGGYSTVGKEFRQNLSKLDVNPSENYDYVEIGSIDVSFGELEKSRLKGEDLPANAKRCLQKGDVIVSKVRTYRGGIAIVPEDNLIGSGAFVVLSETGRIAKEVLYTFLKSKPPLQWSLKPNTGTSYPVIHDSDILNLNIPLFDDALQSDFCDLVEESQNKRKESKRLLEVAKRADEIAIEENEDAAFEYINAETS